MSQTVILYLICINVIGFLLGMANGKMHAQNKGNRFGIPLIVIAICAGAIGVELSLFLFDRKAVKENMLLHVVSLCGFVIEVLIILWVILRSSSPFRFDLWTLFIQWPWLIVYLLLANLVSFSLFGADKRKAIKGKRRIPIVTLLGSCFLGGACGGWIAMKVFRHKTQKDYFTIGVPLMLVTHLVMLFFVINML